MQIRDVSADGGISLKNFLKNMKMKTKAGIGFAGVFLIMFFSAMVGLFGLLDNNRQFNTLSYISEEGKIAGEIDSNMYAKRLAFKKYETDHEANYVDQYNTLSDQMDRATAEFLQISTNQERIDYLKQLMEKSDLYEADFEQYRTIADSIDTTFGELDVAGDAMTDALSIIKEKTFEQDNTELFHSASDSLVHLLAARVQVNKYKQSHLDEEYASYANNYQLFLDDVQKLIDNTNASVSGEIYTIIKYQSKYKADMTSLKDELIRLDAINTEMNTIGPQISALTNKITESADRQNETFKAQIIARNGRNSVLVGIIFLGAILIGSGVVYLILRLFLNPINFLNTTFESIAADDANTDFRLPETSNDEIGRMAKAFNIFMVKIKKMIEDVTYQNLMKTAEADLSEIVRVQEDIDIIANDIITYLCNQFDMLVGVIYLADADGSYRISASYAYTNRKGSISGIKSGDGLVGQVIKEKKMYRIHDLPKDYMLIQSGLGVAQPEVVSVIPCLNEAELVGIIELGSFKDPSGKKTQMLEALSHIIGRTIATVQNRNQMKKLFEKTLSQSETLQVQQEELRQSNEELEEQARALTESESRLQVQQEELRVTNEELETHTKQLEEQKRILNENNKSLTIAQQEMMEKADALEKANKYKSEFLANMSHELRTPLNSILVLSQLLADRQAQEPLTDKEKEFAATINSSGKDLLTLINGVLDLAKVESGKLQVHNEKVNLKAFADEIRNLFDVMAERKNLDFQINIEQELPAHIVTDSLRLSQIVKNLISNAIKFTHKGKIAVNLRVPNNEESVEMKLQPKDYICIEVSDTGIGIPKDKQEEVFEAFKQSDGTTSRQYGGTGLGLTISLQLAKLLGGYIHLDSEAGFGSVFTLIIPKNPVEAENSNLLGTIDMVHQHNKKDVARMKSSLQDTTLDAIENEASVLKQESVNDETSKDTNAVKKVLIIEDDPVFADILADMARDKGYEAIIANTGKEGIGKAKTERPTGIILDIGLPDMDGMILAKMLSTESSTQHIPIHVISGCEDFNSSNPVGERPESIIGFLKKPVDIKAIYTTLAKIEKIAEAAAKSILVVGNCGNEDFKQFTQLGQVNIQKVLTAKEAFKALEFVDYSCIILDIKLPDASGIDFMTKLRNELQSHTPIVIYTEEEISAEKIDDLYKYAESIILKSPKSKERLVDEVSLFLYDVHKNQGMNQKGKNITTEDHNALKDIRVLLADDDSRNVFALMHLLELNGMLVLIAKDGFEAVKLFEEEKVDIVLMDIMMPQMDGYEAIKKIRETSKGKHVPIIALTAKAMSDDREKCINAGANDYLTKPIDASRLLSTLKVWLS